jgi:Planctomycete cytochrome C
MLRGPRVLRAAALTLLCTALGATTGCAELDPDFGALVVRGGTTGPGTPDAGGGITFAHDIRPLIARLADDPSGPGCKKCHYSTQPEHVGFDLGGLDLATLGSLRKGGTTSGDHIVVPGDPESSVIIQKLEGTYGYGAQMPRNSPRHLGVEEIDLVKSWILAGAKGADDE